MCGGGAPKIVIALLVLAQVTALAEAVISWMVHARVTINLGIDIVSVRIVVIQTTLAFTNNPVAVPPDAACVVIIVDQLALGYLRAHDKKPCGLLAVSICVLDASSGVCGR